MKISVSRLKTFKSCRRAYYFRYVEELVPTETAEPLAIGSRYHELVEKLNRGESIDDEPKTKELAMAMAYEKYVLPKMPKVVEAESWYEQPITDEDSLIGRLDGVAEDGAIVEHKTTSQEITEEYEYDLMWDEQILAYMAMKGTRKAHYTVCRKPTIRQKKDESDEAFYDRMCEWYDTDTDSKIRLLEVTRTDAEVEQFLTDLKAAVADMHDAKSLYRNTLHCFRWGRRCEYAQICLDYDASQQYVNFKKKENE